MSEPENLEGIAIVGMSGRFPGARDLEEYWRNLREGRETISFFRDEELLAAGVDPEILQAPDYVRAGGVLEGIEDFDAAFFGFTAREAELLDPHHRLFLEQAWQALEHAGYDADRYPGSIGVFGGMGMGEYLVKNLRSNPDVLRAAGGLRLRIYNDKDFLASLTAYKLNLKGPSATVQTACSTSLVAASLACQSLTGYQCDMALAGGVCLSVPSKAGYFAHEGVFSPDGHCRAFDAGAQGTVSGAGAGLLLLKRLADAVADGDTIHAVIKGWAMNNDGSLKVGYTAPSLEGQAEVIAMAQAVAGVDPDTVSYIEAHGTGTPLGDQIEVAALTQVFRESTDRTGFCAIGSVKTNIGHLDAAAGAAALIKTALALRHREIPPSLNFRSPNPAIDFAAGPFYVNAERRAWESDGGPRRAGVSAFAVGGVNAHLVVEEAPPAEESGPGRPWQLLVLSARTPAALEAATDRLADFLERERPDLADAAFTLQAGRRAFPHRRALACRDVDDAVTALRGRDPRRLLTGAQESKGRPVAFLFPGLGNHYVGMARGLYEVEEVFRRHLDECAELLRPALGLDFRTVLFPENAAPEGNASGPDLRRMLRRGAEPEEGAGELVHTRLAQPVLFAVEYALARLWMAWGVRPRALAGYSLGEYVAACLAGVFTLEDALALVAERARLIDGLPAGAMLAVPLAEEEARRLLGTELSLAAVTGPEVSVVAGPVPAVEELERRLAARGISCRRLETTHAFHSSMMDPIVERFAERVRAVPRSAPSIPFVSNVTGSWITAEQAVDPRYWAEHLRRPVRFADTLRELWREPGRALLEVGPGQALSAWALQLPAEPGEEAAPRVALPTLRHAYDPQPDLAFLLSTVGRLWLAGVDVPGEGFWAGQRRRRVPLPSYPFERRRYWVEPRRESFAAPQRSEPSESLARAPLADWFWTPVWRETALAAAPVDSDGPWLLLLDGDSSFGLRLAERLEERGDEVVLAVAGERFERAAPGAYAVDPADAEGLSRLFAELREQGLAPARIVHLWSAGLPGLIALAQALGSGGTPRGEGGIDLAVIAGRAWAVTGEEELSPAAAALLAACPVVALEIPGVTCRAIDLPFPAPGGHRERDLIERLLAELDSAPTGDVVAFRGGRRWSRGFEPLRLGHAAAPRRGGVWMIVGGVGGLGGVLARELARSCRAKLVLVGRSAAAPPAGLEELGAEVLVVAADVTDREAMRRARAAAEERFGAIHGVIHAAGVPPGGMIQLKTREALDRVLAPKIEGVRVLEEVFADAELDALIVFSSLTATLGAFGLVDHAAANAWLDAWAHDAARHGLPALAVDWDAWLEVGQAAAAAAGHGVATAITNAGHPLLGAPVESGPERSAWSARLSPRTHWALDEHRIAGRGLLPGTAYLEMARAAGAELFGGGAVELRQVVFAAPLIVGDGEERETRTVAEKAGEAWDLRISSRAGNGDWTEHARAKVRPHASAEPARADLDRLREACQGGAGASPTGERERGIGFGPRWRDLLRGLDAGPDQALARLELPAEFAADLDSHPLHPALLDAATGFVQLRGEGTYLPLGYERIVVHGGLPARVWSHARFAGGGGDTIACDLTLLDERGEARLEIEGYTLRRIADPAALAAASAAVSGDPAAESAPVLDGIRPDEGAEAFRRLLAAGMLPPQVLVSTRPFPAVLRQARSRSRERLLEEAEKIHASGGAVHARPDLPTPFVAPRTGMETRLADLWRELLGLEAVGVHDDFFDLGGDSLLATRLIGTLDEVFGAQLSLRAVFEAPTVADLAVVLVQAHETPGEPPQRSIPVRSRDTDRFPLSPAQLRFWFLDRLQPGTAAYNIPVAARLRGDLDRAALERAFGALVERHESLRTTIAEVVEESGQPFQVIQPPAAPALPFTDLGHLPLEEREADMRRRAAAEAAAPFDLQRGPLVRFSLLALGPDEHVALLTLHHILADRWSVGVFFQELMALYEAFRAGRPSPLPPPRLQYADYACWQKERLEEGDLLASQLAWWKERLAGLPSGLPLPTDRPRPRGPRAAFRQRHLPFAIERGLADALRALGRGAEASLSMVLLAAFQALLARLSRQDDVVVGSPIANRGRFGLQDLIGYFAQDLVLRTDLSGDPPFRELLGRVREVTLGAYDHADVPFEKLIEALRPDRGAGGQNPFSQIFFVLENVPMPSAGPAGLAIEGVEVERQAGQFELLAYLAESEDGVSGSLFYDADLFEDDTLRLFAASLRSFLERAVADPETRLSALPLAGDLEARAEAARRRDEEREIAVAATFTADPVAEPLAVWMEELGVPARVEMAPFNQVFQQLLDPAGRFARNARGANIVLVRFEDWDGATDSDANVRELAAALRAAAARSRVPFLAAVCPASPGNEARSAERERDLAAALEGAAGVHLVGADEAFRLYPVPRVHDPAADEIGRVPYTEAFFAALGTLLARKIHSLRGNPYKVIAVDCDNTLWSGVCGEDGPEGVRIDGPRRALQELLVAQHGAGALICLCSKNSAADVDEVFARRSDMPLRPEHVVARRVDWQPKSANLRALAAELGLGLDSFLVIDDNPVECAEIRAHCPEALVLQLPEREEELPRFLRDTWVFDRLQVTDEDRRRTELYRQNAERERFRGEAPTFEAFLAGLGLEVAIREVVPDTAPERLARLSQLTWRTNQFNATTRRRSEAELRELLAMGAEARTIEVRDRFGDYGLVGALMFRTAGAALEVDTFLLSCRVLGKGVEHRMLAELGRLAMERGLAEVRVPFVPTARNRPALDFLESTGGAWREADGEGLLFRFPAAQAAETTLTPASTPAAVPDDAPAMSAVDRGGDADLLRRIAALSDPAVVLERVRARRRLRHEAAPDGEVEYAAPRTPIEEMLAEIWMELLGAERVGVHDSFFRLGGHSLLGTVLLSRIRDAFEVEIPLFALFEAPTLGGLAARVEETLIRDSGAEIEEGLAELAGLSDEEVRALLEAEGEGLAEWRDLAR